MCANRVDELEARVAELEASIEGLTDELVECKGRIKELESELEGDVGLPDARGATAADERAARGSDVPVGDAADRTNREAVEASDDQRQATATADAGQATSSGTAEAATTETATTETEAPVDAETAAADGDESETDESDADTDSDIIVA